MRACRILAAAALAFGTATAQNAILNIVMDDSGTAYLNGTRVAGDTNRASVPVTVVQGQNVLAVHVRDAGYLGGFAASIDLTTAGTADTFISDASAKLSDAFAADWYTAAFSDAAWRAPGAYGPVADDTGGHAKVGDPDSNAVVNALWRHKAQWLWTPGTVYMRKSFTHAGGTAIVGVMGGGFGYKLYLNGALLGESAIANDPSAPVRQFPAQTLLAGENVIAIEATCLDSVGLAYVKAGVYVSAQNRIVIPDSTWKYSFDLQSGWDSTGFSDASWKFVQTKAGTGGPGPFGATGKFMWPSDMYFRLSFNVPTAGVQQPLAARVGSQSQLVGREHYTLQGVKVPSAATAGRAAGVLVERRVRADGTVEAGTVRTDR